MLNSDSIAIGGFDGMHVGHQHLFEKLGENGCIVVIDSGHANLTPFHEREKFTHHPVYYFSLQEIRHLDAVGFINLLKKVFKNLKRIIVGYDFHFGKDRAYNFDDIIEIFDGEVVVIDEVKVNNISVHSRRIRQALHAGEIKLANALLGHSYTLCGTHIAGQGIGAKELVATINLEVKKYQLPKEGVYVTLSAIDDEEHFHPSITFLGHRTTTDGSYAVETHILDGEVTCKQKVRVAFIDFVRENRKFKTLQELKEQINRDINIAKEELKMLQL